MQCPKCGHQQEAMDKCASCGVYFSKLGTTPAAPAARKAATSRAEPTESRIGIGALGITAVVTALLVFAVMHKRKAPTEAAHSPAGDQRVIVVQAPPIIYQPDPATTRPAPASAQPAAAEPASQEKPLEAARNATVLIETGVGLGSGFIIDGQCHVVTNRHVVDMNGARMADEVVRDPEAQAAIAAARQRLQRQINAAQQRLVAIRNQPGTNLEQADLEERIVEMQKQIADPSVGLKDYVSKTVDKAGRAGFKATLPDGSHYDSLYAKVADGSDLALFTLPAKFCSSIRPGRSKDLAYGQRLYTIGNPAGMTYTLTSGVFSGERMDGETRYLQTDAPINPGNSGGPLLTEDGRVVGINSMILKDTQGIGFAIPIEAVFDAFPELRGSRPGATD
jgi:serine protease Do